MDRAENIRRIKEQAKKAKKDGNPYRIPKVSAKRKEKMKEDQAIRLAGGGEMDRWFEARREEMQGFCLHCGGRSCKDNDKYFKFSIAHLLPKNLFKSIKAHPLNWIELCFWDKSCHTNYDNKTLDIIELNCLDQVIERFIAIYPDIAAKEWKYIPDVLLHCVKNERDTR